MPVDLIIGSNSYIDIAAADKYFSERLHADAWSVERRVILGANCKLNFHMI